MRTQSFYKLQRIVIFALCCMMVLSIFSGVPVKAAPVKNSSYPVDLAAVTGEGFTYSGGKINLDARGVIIFEIEVPKDGDYWVGMEYLPTQDIVMDSTITVYYEDTRTLVQVNSIWKDESKEYLLDRYGNEILADQVAIREPHTDLWEDSVPIDKEPLVFHLKKGKNSFRVENAKATLEISRIFATPCVETPNYDTYRASISDTSAGSDYIIIEAENYDWKTDSYIRSQNVQDSALYPYDSYSKKLNVIDEDSFYKAGQEITWKFTVEDAGNYKIGFRYAQIYNENISSYATIRIDGEIPFAEAESYPFYYTMTDYENLTMSRGDEALSVYLDAGEHTISVQIDAAPVSSFVERVSEIIQEISDIGLEISKIAGDNVDSFRTWDIETYIPGIVETLDGYRVELAEMYTAFREMTGSNPKVATNLNLASKSLETLLKKPKKLPAKLTLLSQGSGSVTQMLSDFNTDIQYQYLSLDRIYLYNDQELEPAKAGFFADFIEGCKRFFNTIFNPQSGYTAGQKQKGEINVWMNRPLQYVETLQALADTKFTPETGISVKLSVMPDERKLILSNASNTSPDIAMSLYSQTPFDLALRGAITDFNQFEDFDEFVKENFSIDVFETFVYDDKIYGFIETQDFFITIYRTDIMESLGLEVPKTWDDVAEMMPVLRRNGMNFSMPLSTWSGTKPIYSSAPFLFQANAQIYTDDGHGSLINSEESLRGFEVMTSLYSLYSLQLNVSNFYNSFRYGVIPVGVGAFGDYVRLLNAAPEIADRWAIALPPGMEDEEGNINHSFTAAERADVIFESSEMKEESWEFLKWWMSEDTQVEYAYTLQTKYGPEYMWNSANLKAFDQLQLAPEHREVILEQWTQIQEVPRHPAGYMLEREFSNAWLAVVDQGKNPRVALDEAAINLNREIKRKLEEFEYIKGGVKVRDYIVRDPAAILE